ncbi:enoyl-CoA hydratase/isomerase family protein [Halomonas sp. HP20-15]|uniref:enoyl-CoA hydratase/isomerase family protein n=1 Tax=Halomonas sp. HP20-15 TaxID=3085901 RepID=UPI002980FF3A|nr:enoyl-CoA hydratase/isomerase family protein [Halomonas sp. HP20-15]MDW5377763.1 enoyl-CoA hydratase/isomerase family protein [Halomonas sp. HP20-15]
MSERLKVSERPGALTVSLNRPDKRNALSSALVEDLIGVIDDASRRGIEVIAFQGEGKNFSAGFDFTNWQEHSEGDLVLRFVRIEQLLQRIVRSPAHTMAFAHGRNFGAGVDLFAVCRQRICTPDTTFRMPGLKFGLVLGTRRFASIVGRDRAHEILSSTRTFDAAEANRIGFSTRVAERDEWKSLRDEATAGIPDPSRALLNAALADRMLVHDLASLVESAATPGLKQRIETYLG